MPRFEMLGLLSFALTFLYGLWELYQLSPVLGLASTFFVGLTVVGVFVEEHQ